MELVERFHVSVNQVAQLTSYSLLVIAGCAYPYSVLSRKYGKRGPFLFALAVLVAADAWAGLASSYHSMLGARMLSGVGQSMFEALSLGIIPDLFFVHERGKRVALFLFVSQSGVTLGQPIATKITTRFGLKWCFAGLAISEAIMFIATFFFFFECTFMRDQNNQSTHPEDETSMDMITTSKQVMADVAQDIHVEDIEQRVSITGPPRTYIQKLHIYNGVFTDSSVFGLGWRSICLSFHPTIFLVAIAALPLSWPVGISFILSPIMHSEPYNFSTNGVANMFIAAWLGTVGAFAIGATVDWFVKFLARRNGDIYEPEFRLWYMIPGWAFFFAGWLGFGFALEAMSSWVALAFCFALIYTGACVTNISLVSYLLDAHEEYAVESQVILFAFKNLFAFGMGFFFVDWYYSSGPRVLFGVVGGVVTGITLLIVPLYIGGKLLRVFWTKHWFLNLQ
ncbi:hypothetical protein FE257_006451 [Aspergillus nanangensis]|uniref:Major facilitator superfamily (MFS) profile domain-containing protein n=1 Tax=Aspergillus nanangensis TaxID=2582783 RepID=A0AAD4GZ38_ASPNN|nr:hypothetical protein FE257_006451 [Aspergillus nanangensis]